MLGKAKAHFKQILEHEGLRCILVPEWGDENQPAKIYFKSMSALPVKTYSRLVELGSQQTVEAFIDILILRCCDEQGKPLFKLVDKTEMLREISPIVVCEIIRQMGEAEKETSTLLNLEIVEKKLLADPDVFCLFALADRLHQTLDTILMMPMAELIGWFAYLNILKNKSP